MGPIAKRFCYFRERIVPHLGCDPTEDLILLGYFCAPASTKYHGSYVGGLFDHSMIVTQQLVNLTDKLGLQWERPESPYIVGAFHDLCKCDQYIELDTDPGCKRKFACNDLMLLHGHGEKSVMVASTLTRLTMEEVACIRYHMGAFTDKEQWSEYTDAIHDFPNVLWTHTADMDASHIIEQQPDATDWLYGWINDKDVGE